MLCNIGYSSETHLKLKSCEVLFTYNVFISYPIVSNFCTEYNSHTSVLCAKCRNDWTTEKDVMDERDFVIFEVKVSFGWKSYIAQHPRGTEYTFLMCDSIRQDTQYTRFKSTRILKQVYSNRVLLCSVKYDSDILEQVLLPLIFQDLHSRHDTNMFPISTIIMSNVSISFIDQYFCHNTLPCIFKTKTSGISRTKSQNLNASCTVFQLSFPNLLQPGFKLIMKM